MSDGCFTGIRVLDFTRVVAGPYCTLLLSDLGAEVIKVERPLVGDDSRAFGPPFIGGESPYFMGLNRGKRSAVIDLDTSAGREAARRLALGCDVVIENFRPGFMERVGLDYAALSPEHPRLVYCSITGFGEEGPYRDHAGYDVMVSALGGMMGITGLPGQPPVKTGVAMLDLSTALYAFGGIAAALYDRERTGLGQRVQVSLLEAQVANLINAASAYLMAGQVMGPQGNQHPSIVPYQAFGAADGWILIGAANDAMFTRLAVLLGSPEWTSDPRFATNAMRVANRAQLVEMIAARVAAEPVAHWVQRLGPAGVAVAPVNRIDQVFDDPHVQRSGQVETVDDPQLGPLRVVRSPLRMSRTPVRVSGPAPRLGEHTDEVLSPQSLGSNAPPRTRSRPGRRGRRVP